ncbi:MAG: hypothetical protein PUE90_10395 [Bacteroidales bacterium]|nr:hypothetical protein [Bacteroidales bacterium]
MLTKALKIVDIKERALTIENIINLKTMPNPTHHPVQLIYPINPPNLPLIQPGNSSSRPLINS